MSQDEVGRYGHAGMYNPFANQTADPYPAIPVPPPGQFAQGYATVATDPGKAAHFVPAFSLAQAGSRESVIGSALSEHEKSVEVLWQVVGMLEQRLVAVLSPVGPQQGSGVQTAPKPARPPMAEDLKRCTSKVIAIENKLREITDRIEV